MKTEDERLLPENIANYDDVIPDEYSVQPCVSCGIPIVRSFQVKQCKMCQTGLTPDSNSLLYTKAVCVETHRTPAP